MLLFKNIKSLVGLHTAQTFLLRGAEMKNLPSLNNAWLAIENGKIKAFGEMSNMPSEQNFEEVINAEGKFILPTWCDSHTHIVFAAPREEEFEMKIKGKSYEEIAAAGGGILNSAKKLQAATEDLLYLSASKRLKDLIKLGTGCIEIKSGYGLTTDAELKMLRVIKRLKKTFPIPIKATFLAAHAYPAEFKNNHEGYIRLIIDEMLPKIAEEKLADYIDVFCEKGFFSNEETERILNAGLKYGLKPKIHVNQLSISGGVQVGVKNYAVSVDHLEEMDNDAINCLGQSKTIGTILPSCSFYLGIPFANARGLINANAAIAIASDFNPGSTPSGNMNFVVSLACIKLKLFPEEAINAATINGAAALELQNEVGSIAIGKCANLILTKEIPSLAFIPYSFGQPQIDAVYINGKIYNG